MTRPAGSPEGLVCLGASAGGLRSLQAVLGALPADFPWPVLVALHVRPEPPSLLASILERGTLLAVKEAEEGEPLRPGTVYVSRSDAELGVTPDFRVAMRPLSKGRPQRIDFLFSTSAAVARAQTVAVVLSGDGSDGAAGSLVVKLNGGSVLAERDGSARHPSMPHAAAAAGTVDALRDRDQIAPLLAELAGGRLKEANAALREDVTRIVAVITQEGGADFARYRQGTLARRIQRRMAICGFASPEAYRQHLLTNAEEREALRQSFLVLVTEFFRDPEAWRLVEERVVPALAARVRAGRKVRVWSAGCATGEEAYTIAMLLRDAIPGASPANVEIVATDLDDASLAHAREGLYHEARLRNVSPVMLARHFDLDGTSARVKDDLRDLVRFRRSDLTREAPEGAFDFVVCRNVLIYFNEKLQGDVFGLLEGGLAPGAFLLLGQSESPPRERSQLAPAAERSHLFVVGGDGAAIPVASPAPSRSTAAATEGALAPSLVGGIGDALMGSSSLFAFIVDDETRVLAMNRLARALLAPRAEGTLLVQGHESTLRDAVRLAIASGSATRLDCVGLDPDIQFRFDFVVEPLPRATRAALVVGPAASDREPSTVTLSDPDSIADLLATNEELQAANEELAATNEELQAANEELASLNEEFQSNNEVLGTRNVDLEAGATSSRARNILLRAMVAAGRAAIIACDAEQRVVVCTAQAASLLRISGDCLGKPLAQVGLPIPAATLEGWLEDARRNRAPVRQESPAPGGGALTVEIEFAESVHGGSAGWVLAWRVRNA